MTAKTQANTTRSSLFFSQEIREEVKEKGSYLQRAEQLVEMNDALDDLLPRDTMETARQDGAWTPHCLSPDQITS